METVVSVVEKAENVVSAVEKAETVVSVASEIVDFANSAVDAASTAAATAGMSFVTGQASRVVSFIGALCGGASNLLAAIAPALPIVGAAVSLGAIAVGQVQKYSDALEAVAALRATLRNVTSIIDQFKHPALAVPHAELLADTLRTLHDATAFIAKNFAKPKALKEVANFFCADANLQTLTDARTRLDTLVGHMGDAAATAAAIAAVAAKADTTVLLQGQDKVCRAMARLRLHRGYCLPSTVTPPSALPPLAGAQDPRTTGRSDPASSPTRL